MHAAESPPASETPAAGTVEKHAPSSWWGRLRAVFQRYSQARVIIIGYGFFASGGAWKSIHQYYSYLSATGEKAVLIHRPSRNSTRQMLMAFFVGRRVLFNGLDSFYHFGAILFCLLRSDVTVYLHETKFIFDTFQQFNPRRYRLVRHIIKRNRICCVSQQQENFLRTQYGARHTHIVYENISPPAPYEFDASCQSIVMVGSLDARKGASLFSEVADAARQAGRPWRFYWVGPRGGTHGLYLSANVVWLGARPDVYAFLSRADLFFLSSVDDPFPLSCLEALSLYRKCVVYRETGLAEVLDGIRGCAVYENHNASAAYAAITRALEEELDLDRVRKVNESISSVSAFADRMEDVLTAYDHAEKRAPLPPLATRPETDSTNRH